jgi:hypothetical protein
MVGDQVAGAFEPEVGNRGQDRALARNRRRQHHVESREPVGGDDQQVVFADPVDVAHLAAIDQRQGL